MTLADDQQARLRQAKLTGLVRAHGALPDDTSAVAGNYPGGATLVAAERAWVLVDDVGPRSAGGPLLWATRQDVLHLTVVLGEASPDVLADLARRLAYFRPVPEVVHVEGSGLVEVGPSPPPPVDPPSSGAGELVDTLLDAHLEVVVEQGVIRGELLGLEVARIVGDGDALHMEVGVGKFDRVTAAMMYADLPTADALGAVVDQVRRHRYPGAPPHPVRDLCRERWLRHTVLADPESVGAVGLSAVETTVERDSLRAAHPAMAVGSGANGPVVVACTFGVDVDLLPLAADARAVHAPDAELVVVSVEPLPPAVHDLGATLPGGVRFVEIPAPWA